MEASVQLPGANNVLGFWPAVWTVGNLGRAGYGASLDGIVRIYLYICFVGYQSFSYSGHTHTIAAMWVQWPIKLSMANQLQQQQTEILAGGGPYPTFLAKGYRGAHAQVKLIRVRNI